MPELIDLEVARENMLKRVKDRKLTQLTVYEPKVFRNIPPEDAPVLIEGKMLEDIGRVAKFLKFSFEDVSVAVHLMLHGDFCWGVPGKKEKNACFAFEFGEISVQAKDWSRWMKVEFEAPTLGSPSPILDGTYGIDLLSDEFTKFEFAQICSKKERTGIKRLLMDQAVIAGIGNAYADEILWNARIHPTKSCGAIIEEKKVEALFSSIKDVLAGGLEAVRVRAGGESISEQERDFMKVYRHSGEKCPECGHMIACLKVNGRDTFVCEKCQKK